MKMSRDDDASPPTMPSPIRFCAEESAAIGDPLVGSAAHARCNLLISWPRAKWTRSLRRANDMTDILSATIDALVESGRRVNLIHRQGQPSHRHRVFMMPERRAYEISREELPDFLQALLDGTAIERWQAEEVEGSLVLCCTHGKKDKCCAKFGYRTYKAIASTARQYGRHFDVWESTHLGGCRLAASTIVLPELRKYGRIGDTDVAPLLDSEAKNRPYLPCYRGDSQLSPAGQCAQVAALTWLQARGLHAEITVDEGPQDTSSHQCMLTVHWSQGERHGRLDVTCHARELLRHDTCADFDGEGPHPSIVWYATNVSPAA